ncbi:uncharacterized protein LOC114272993 isoform X1 [Camellia sinensis]|uniref:Ribosomal protein L34Ae n=1 Tax=Camellia sinensis var. sinensis TaxID=542762 RepID=A0A4S4EJ13_CAMSN|nr:uncharacterized protein LOC114272993 isoform X1 [Camellia sinensis]THG16531.1 hypothetical protein TEA_011767 [Camellia sinensis var. sinensis]
MQCSKETLASLFYNVSSSFLLLFLFFYFTSIFLAKLFHYCGSPIFQRTQDVYDFAMYTDEDDEEEENGYIQGEYKERDHLVADIIHSGEALQFLPVRSLQKDLIFGEEDDNCQEPVYEESQEAFHSPASESEEHDGEEEIEEEILARDTDSVFTSDTNDCGAMATPPITMDKNKSETHDEKCGNQEIETEVQANFTHDENFLIFAPPKLETKKLQVQGKDIDEEIFGDSCTVGSTSKSSSEWRSSINYRDSGTEDPFSSSSRRSCPKWESYTVFQKYDEEMLFLDRISAQKLHETESLRSIQACPRSISERIVYKLANKKSSKTYQNPYQELEAAYVAQICLTWEALNWNYKYFHRLRASRRESDPGCPAYIAQQFQQFLVLLQRYVENEPYEHGKRPEIYAKMRSLAPKLLQVPEYRDSNDEEKEEGLGTRISSDSFLQIMEEAIRTFMNFLKADKETHCQILAAFFKRNRRGSADPTRLLLLKKLNKKKKLKLKDLRRTHKCLKKRRLKEGEEIEILMALIDTKVVSRVLRMSDPSEEQLHWCDNKMSKVRVVDGKLQRDSSPLFFPAH